MIDFASSISSAGLFVSTSGRKISPEVHLAREDSRNLCHSFTSGKGLSTGKIMLFTPTFGA